MATFIMNLIYGFFKKPGVKIILPLADNIPVIDRQ